MTLSCLYLAIDGFRLWDTAMIGICFVVALFGLALCFFRK